MGERSITKLKKSLPHGAHLDGSVRSAIRRYFVDVVLSQLMEGELFRHKNIKNIEYGGQYAIDEGDSPFEQGLNNNENCTKESYDRYRRFRVYKSSGTVQASIEANQPIALVYCGRHRKIFILVWESVDNCRQRTMNIIDFSGGTVHEGTYMVTKQAMLDSFGNGAISTSNRKPIFNYDIVSEATACAALPYMIWRQNESHDLVSDIQYFVRTEDHVELREVAQGNPVFSYPLLYSR